MNREEKLNFLIDVAHTTVVLVLIYIIPQYFLPLVWPFISGLVIAYALRGVITKLSTALHLPHKVTVVAVTSVFYIGLAAAIWWGGVLLLGGIYSFAQGLPHYYENTLLPAIDNIFSSTEAFFSTLPISIPTDLSDLSGYLGSLFEGLLGALSPAVVDTAGGWFGYLPVFAIGFVFSIVSSFMIGLGGDGVFTFILSALPGRAKDALLLTKDFSTTVLLGYLKAYGLIMFITFCELSLGFFLLGVDNMFYIAFLVALLDIFPIFGIGTVLIPWGVVSLFTNNIPFGVAILVMYATIAFIRSIIEPKIVSLQLGLHPLATLVAIFIGVRLFGVSGVLLGPIVLLFIVYLNNNGIVKLFPTAVKK